MPVLDHESAFRDDDSLGLLHLVTLDGRLASAIPLLAKSTICDCSFDRLITSLR